MDRSERGVKPCEEVIEGQHPKQPLASVELVARDAGQARPHRRPAIARGLQRKDHSLGIRHSGTGRLVCLTPGEGWRVPAAKPADI